MKTISWFSAGVSSAVATKLLIKEIDEVYYIHIDDQHPDTIRFVKDCEKWFQKDNPNITIQILQSKYKNVENACLALGKGWINGRGYAPCTKLLKKRVRKEWELNQTEKIRYVWGMDFTEKHRCIRIEDTMLDQDHVFPLVDLKYTKQNTHEILKASGIKRPKMYELGYYNNNCIGCVKGGAGYWNKIKIDFPEIFKARAKLERKVGHSCLKKCFLDELKPEQGHKQKPIVDECGIFCELDKL